MPALLLAFWASYSCSETIYGITTNAAFTGLNWTMSNILPDQAGLQVTGVVYQYTAIKDPEDDMIVYVQNQNAQSGGYVFRETDDWSGLPGNTINKLIPVGDIPIQLWGDGSIDIEGQGQVTEPNVVYTYKYDPCFDPQSDPSCPGYMPPIPEPETIDVYDALNDQAVLDATKETDPDLFDRDNKNRREAKKEPDDRLEQGLAASENALNIASGAAQDFMVAAMANEMRFDPYYATEIKGGVYLESVTLPVKDIPDNPRGLRNGLAQQLLHQKMIESQYK